MAKIILDMGSGNTCRNDRKAVALMIDAVRRVDSHARQIIFKWQLFQSAPPNIPLERSIFDWAYNYAWAAGYETTSSVFDVPALDFLLTYKIPFVKIACRPELYELAYTIPDEMPIVVSFPSGEVADEVGLANCVYLCCIPQYPASIEDYESRFSPETLSAGISDHTVGWELFRKYKPEIIEKHFCIEHCQFNPDGGPFAVTAAELSEVM